MPLIREQFFKWAEDVWQEAEKLRQASSDGQPYRRESQPPRSIAKYKRKNQIEPPIPPAQHSITPVYIEVL
jgi:hypothetical protein